MTLAELLDQAMALPEEDRKKLAAKLLGKSAPAPKQPRRAGSAAGRVHMAKDFRDARRDPV